MDGATLTIPVTGLLPLRGYPVSGARGPIAGRIVFRGVASSARKVIEYIGSSKRPQGYKAPYVIEDIIDSPAGEPLRKFQFEGFQPEPEAWIEDWTIRAQSFELFTE
jgi:hypothetical protein